MTNSPLLQKMLRDAHESVMREIAADRETPIPAEDQIMDKMDRYEKFSLAACRARIAELESALTAERTRLETLEQLLREIEPYLDSLVCYASTVAEYPPNGLPDRVRAALANGGSEHGK